MTDTSPMADELSPARRALLALEDMRNRLDVAERAAHQPVAIIGMGCRMPGGADTPEAFWQLLADGVDAIGEIPAERWDMDDLHDPDPDVPGKIVSRAGGFVDDVELFDPQFFGISPREAVTMDPQQRLLLEVSWEALESAGIAPASLVSTRTGVYVGIGIYDYAHLARESMEAGALELDAYVGTGSSASVAAGRISFALGLRGPAMAVDTACSSSLVSVHLACQALRTGEADVALAGGASLIFIPGSHIYMSQLGALSPTGRCRAFDASADGYVRSEGAAMIALKRLSDAVADGDNVLAVIRGTAVNHDGRSSGLTVPNGNAQQEVIRAALDDAGIDADVVSYVEAHGTGTPLGDPIEVRALDAVYGPARATPLQIGSVKTNIGHLESASGIAGLLKLVLALQHESIPGHLHLEEPTPFLDWDELSVDVPTEARPWPRTETPRIGGINSFGLSGTNSHLLISEAPAEALVEPEPDDRPVHVLTLSARSGESLSELATATAAALRAPGAPTLADAARTLNTGRNPFGHRLAVVAGTGEGVASALERFAADAPGPDLVARTLGSRAVPKVAFLFTGQGSQRAGMGRELYEAEPVFRDALDRCAAVVDQHLDQPLLSVMHPGAGVESPIDDTTYTQPALFALEYALATMWEAWGVRPELMLGHSIGSYVAAHLAGVMSLEDALLLVAARGRLMGSLPAGGSMAAVFADDATFAQVLDGFDGRLSIAATNGPDNTVVSGPDADIALAVAAFAEAGVRADRLTTSHAFHSALMEPILDDFRVVVDAIEMHPPRSRRMVSDLTGAMAGDEVATASYWVEHLRSTVRFRDGMTVLADEGANVFLEVGPSPTLTAIGRRCLPDAPVAWAASLQAKRGELERVGLAAGELWTAGVDVDWDAFDGHRRRRRVPMPTARFQRQRHWVPEPEVRHNGGNSLNQGHPLLGIELVTGIGPRQFEAGIASSRPTFLGDRTVHGRIEVPTSAMLETVAAAGAELWGESTALDVTGLVAEEPVALEGLAQRYQTAVEMEGTTQATISVRASDMAGRHWDLVGTATVGRLALEDLARIVPPAFRPPGLDDLVPMDLLYEEWREAGLILGGRTACVDARSAVGRTLIARIALPFGAERFSLYPPLVEVCALALADEPRARAIRGIGRARLLSRELPAWCVRDLDAADDTLWFFDADGQLVATVGELAFRELAPDAAPPRTRWAYELSWRPVGEEPIPLGQRPAVEPGTWLLVGTDERVDDLAAALGDRGIPTVRLDRTLLAPGAGAALEQLLDDVMAGGPPLSHVVVAGGTAGSEADEDLPARSLRSARELLHLVQAVTAVTWRRRVAVPPQLWLVTEGAMAVDGADVTAPDEAALWGLVRTVASELPQFYGGMIDLDPSGPVAADPAEGDTVVDLVLTSGDETWLARRAGETRLARLRPAEWRDDRPIDALSPGGAYLVTGGFGALGLATARELVERGARRVVLVGRSPVPPRAEWAELADDDPAAARVGAVRDLEARGATVHVATFDIADPAALASFLAGYRAEGWPPIRGVFHAAGVLRDGSVSDMGDEDVATAFAPKVDGTWNLHQQLAAEPLDHFVLFSSAAGLLGSPGQANYGAANAFMDAVAHLRRAAGRPALSVNWGAWAAGMADRDDLEQQRSRQGQLAIPVHAGMALLFELIGAAPGQALVMPMTDAQIAAAAATPLLSELVDESDVPAPSAERLDHGAQILAAPAAERSVMMLGLVRTRIGGVLGMHADAVEPDSGLIELGLDSIMIVEVSTRLSVELGIGLSPREVFEEPSVHSLAATLLEALGQRPGAGAAGDGVGAEVPGAGSVLVVASPGSGIPAIRAALAAAAPSMVSASDARPSVESFTTPSVVLSDQLGVDLDQLVELVDQLPGLRIVHLSRHPFSVIEELGGAHGQGAAEELWRTAAGNLLDLAEQLGLERVRMVRLEDVIEAGDPVDALLAVVGAEREVGAVGGAPFLDGERLDGWRRASLAERPGRGVRQMAEELGYETEWPVAEFLPARGSGA